jgi:uncharacterized SAM-binding protein YcdF (DUF218 family)
MILVLSKILPQLFFPLGLACLLCLLALIALVLGRRKLAGFSLGAALILLYAFSTPMVTHALLHNLEDRYPQAATYPVSPAIVILGGAGLPAVPPRRYPETNAYADRILYGARLYKQGLAPKVVVTGGKITFLKDFHGTEAGINAQLLIELLGVDSAAIIKADASRNTYEDGQCVRKRFEELGLKKEVILVTSAAHMPRSVAVFEKQGFLVHPAPADFHADSADAIFKPIYLLPEESCLYDTWYALHETIGWAAYRILGWI